MENEKKREEKMTEYYITVRSVTYAQKISEILKKGGVRPKMVRRPRNLDVGGCGYAVMIRGGDPSFITEVAASHGFRIYATEDGKEFKELGYFQKR